MLRAFYYLLASLMCLGLVVLGLWPSVIKPCANSWINKHVNAVGLEHGLILHTGEIFISGIGEIEVTSIRAENIEKTWMVQAPIATIELSPIAFFLGTQPLSSVRIKHPKIFARITQSPHSGFDFRFPKTLRHIAIEDGHIHIEDPSHQRAIQILHVDAIVHKHSSTHHASINLNDLWIRQANNMWQFDSLAFLGTLVDDKSSKHLTIHNLSLKAQQGLITLGGETILSQGELEFIQKSMDFYAHGTIAARNIEIDDVNLEAIDAQFQFSNHLIHITDIEALFGDTIVTGKINIDPVDNWQTNISLYANDMSLYAMLMNLGITPSFVDMNLDISLAAQGSLWPQFKLEGDIVGHANNLVVANKSARQLEPQDIVIQVQQPTYLTSKIQIDSSHFRFNDLFIDDGNTQALIQCQLNFNSSDGISMAVSSDHFDFFSIGEKIADESYHGFGTVAASLTGPYDDIRIKARAKLEKFAFENINFGQAVGEITYVGDDLSFTDFHGEYGDTNYSGDLRIRFLEDTVIALKLEKMGISLPSAFEMLKGSRYEFIASLGLEHKVNGRCLGQLEVNGPIEASTKNLQGNLSIRFADGLRIDDIPLDSLAFSGHATERNWFIDSLVAKFGIGSAHLVGEINKTDQSSSLMLKAEKFPLAVAQNFLDDKHLEGLLDAEIKLVGRFDEPQVSGYVNLEDLQTSQWHLGTQRFTLQSDKNNTLRLKGSLLSGSARIESHLEMRSDLNFEVHLEWPHLAFEKLSKEALPYVSTLNFGGIADISGSLNSREPFKALVNFSSVSLLALDRHWFSAGDLKLTRKSNIFYLDCFSFQTEQGDQFRIEGQFNTRDIDLDISASMDLGAIKPIAEALEVAQGRLNANMQLKGDISNPTIVGSASLKNGYFAHSMISDPIEDVEANVLFEGKDFELKALKGRTGSGIIEGYGRGRLSNYWVRDFDSIFMLKYFPLRISNLLSGVVTGSINYHKLDSDVTLSGDLKIREGYMASVFRPEDFKTPSHANTIVRTPIRLDLKIRSDDLIRVDTDLLTGDLKGNLHVVGTHLKPGLKGSLELLSGNANFRGHFYELSKARIDFDDAYKLIPRLDVVATSEIQGYNVQAILQGTLEAPQFQLTSDPYLSESQLLILMSLGYKARDIAGFSTTAQTAGLEALSLYSGLGSNLTRFLNQHNSTRYFQVDELSLGSIYSKNDGVSLPALRLGMNVWSGLRLKLHTAIAEDKNGKRDQRIELEHNLGRRMKWRLGWDSDGLSNYGDAGLDLWYRWELD